MTPRAASQHAGVRIPWKTNRSGITNDRRPASRGLSPSLVANHNVAFVRLFHQGWTNSRGSVPASAMRNPDFGVGALRQLIE